MPEMVRVLTKLIFLSLSCRTIKFHQSTHLRTHSCRCTLTHNHSHIYCMHSTCAQALLHTCRSRSKNRTHDKPSYCPSSHARIIDCWRMAHARCNSFATVDTCLALVYIYIYCLSPPALALCLLSTCILLTRHFDSQCWCMVEKAPSDVNASNSSRTRDM